MDEDMSTLSIATLVVHTYLPLFNCILARWQVQQLCGISVGWLPSGLFMNPPVCVSTIWFTSAPHSRLTTVLCQVLNSATDITVPTALECWRGCDWYLPLLSPVWGLTRVSKWHVPCPAVAQPSAKVVQSPFFILRCKTLLSLCLGACDCWRSHQHIFETILQLTVKQYILCLWRNAMPAISWLENMSQALDELRYCLLFILPSMAKILVSHCSITMVLMTLK